MTDKKFEVFIGCKIGCENYPYLEGYFTGDEIVEHLLSDCGYAWVNDENEPDGGHFVPGDLCIWYLGTNAKHGNLYIDIDGLKWETSWSLGESNFSHVTKFINILKNNSIINKEQYKKLKEAIRIGKTIGDMYLIGDYLGTIEKGEKWIPRITDTKQHMKEMANTIKKYFNEKGMDVKFSNEKQESK